MGCLSVEIPRWPTTAPQLLPISEDIHQALQEWTPDHLSLGHHLAIPPIL